jgi:hypothetical protein
MSGQTSQLQTCVMPPETVIIPGQEKLLIVRDPEY